VLDLLQRFGDDILRALGVTLSMSLISFVLAFVVGMVAAGCRVSPVPPLRRAAALYTEMFRNVPLAVLMVLMFFALPDIGYVVPTFWTAVLALTLYTGSYIGEAIRAGINSVAPGEVEAARALGLGFGQVLGTIVLPQALRTVVAPIGSLFIAHTKNTTVAAVISAEELGDFLRTAGSAAANYFGVAFIVAVLFVLLLIPIGVAFGWVERRVAIRR
jgi:glutamate transport system permease protein